MPERPLSHVPRAVLALCPPAVARRAVVVSPERAEFAKYVYEDQVKLKTARRLDKLRAARTERGSPTSISATFSTCWRATTRRVPC